MRNFSEDRNLDTCTVGLYGGGGSRINTKNRLKKHNITLVDEKLAQTRRINIKFFQQSHNITRFLNVSCSPRASSFRIYSGSHYQNNPKSKVDCFFSTVCKCLFEYFLHYINRFNDMLFLQVST